MKDSLRSNPLADSSRRSADTPTRGASFPGPSGFPSRRHADTPTRRPVLFPGEPLITVGIMDHQAEVRGYLNGEFQGDAFGPLSGGFRAHTETGNIALFNEAGLQITRTPLIRLAPREGSCFQLYHVIIGNQFHWERTQDQTFKGNLILRARDDGTMAVINEILVEDYLESVISSEMNGAAPPQFLKTHAILSRSWLLAALHKKKEAMQGAAGPVTPRVRSQQSIIRWYDREDHDLFDVCADDHCQRYQGITRIVSGKAGEAVRDTRGMVIAYRDEICDARYSKACGGLTEDFTTAWDDTKVPYLTSISDAQIHHHPPNNEEEAARWILSEPEAYCNTKDAGLLQNILPDFDCETTGFFRWRAEYSRRELEEILRDKSGFDFGTLKAIVPLERGPSGRIFRLRIVGSRKTVEVGKELEIRRWLSRSHLYSSAFIVEVNNGPLGEPDQFIFHGAGWGHGVGLCQIGAAVMAARGLAAEEILMHYFPGTGVQTIYP